MCSGAGEVMWVLRELGGDILLGVGIAAAALVVVALLA